MKDIYGKVKPAFDTAGLLSSEALVGVTNGRFEAANMTLRVSVPAPDVPDFTAAAVDFDFAYRRHGAFEKMRVTDTLIILDGRSRIKRLHGREPFKKPEIETTSIGDRDDFFEALADVYPFTVGDKSRPWSEGARFDGTTITATNSVVVLRAELRSACGFEGVTVPRSALNYMMQRREELESWGLSDNSLLLEFTDGSWASCSRMSMEMPDAAVNLVDKAWPNAPLATVDQGDASRIRKTTGWAEEIVAIVPGKVLAGKYSTDHDEVLEHVDMGDNEKVIFSATDLDAVMQRATEIGLDQYPRPVPFTTKRGSRGLIAGRRSEE